MRRSEGGYQVGLHFFIMTAPGRQCFIQFPAIVGFIHAQVVTNFMPQGAIKRAFKCEVIGMFLFDRSLECLLSAFK